MISFRDLKGIDNDSFKSFVANEGVINESFSFEENAEACKNALILLVENHAPLKCKSVSIVSSSHDSEYEELKKNIYETEQV